MKFGLAALLIWQSSFAFAQATYIIDDNHTNNIDPIKGKVVYLQECPYTPINESIHWVVWPWPCGVDRVVLEVENIHKEGTPDSKVCEVNTGDTIVLPAGIYRMSPAKRKHLSTKSGYTHERYTALVSRKLHWLFFYGTYGRERKASKNRFYSIGADCRYVVPLMNPGYYVIYNDDFAYIFNKKPDM